MTDRVMCLNVILSKNVRDDDVQRLVDAIKFFNGVADVQVGPPVTANDMMIEHRLRIDMARKASDAVYATLMPEGQR